MREQKSSDIIALLEEFRRNDPNQGNQRDEVAEALAEPADAQAFSCPDESPGLRL
jgi:hypothetical protein